MYTCSFVAVRALYLCKILLCKSRNLCTKAQRQTIYVNNKICRNCMYFAMPWVLCSLNSPISRYKQAKSVTFNMCIKGKSQYRLSF